MRLYDAHNHLQDERFAGRQPALIEAAARSGVTRMVVNGSCEQDWPQVLALARKFSVVQPSFGCHPWYLQERTPGWLDALRGFLDTTPGAVIGEIGLDRWKRRLLHAGQEEAFTAQMQLAAERDLPPSLHCLQAWGRLHELLRTGPRPRRGFLLHSYGGSPEMIVPLARLGAYFSFPGYFMHERKQRQRETFLQVPPDRLLIETDAPDQQLPETQAGDADRRFALHTLTDPRSGEAINHPANLGVIYEFVARMVGEPLEKFAARVEENFLRLFGK